MTADPPDKVVRRYSAALAKVSSKANTTPGEVEAALGVIRKLEEEWPTVRIVYAHRQAQEAARVEREAAARAPQNHAGQATAPPTPKGTPAWRSMADRAEAFVRDRYGSQIAGLYGRLTEHLTTEAGLFVDATVEQLTAGLFMAVDDMIKSAQEGLMPENEENEEVSVEIDPGDIDWVDQVADLEDLEDALVEHVSIYEDMGIAEPENEVVGDIAVINVGIPFALLERILKSPRMCRGLVEFLRDEVIAAEAESEEGDDDPDGGEEVAA